MMFRRAALAIVLLALAVAPGFAATKTNALDAKIKAQQAKLHVVHTQLNAKRSELDAAAAKVGTIAEQLAIANRNISSVQGQIAFLDAKMHTTQANLQFNHVQLDAAQKTLALHNDALKHRLIQAYEYGDLGYLAVLMQAKTFGDFVERWNDVAFVVKANESTIRQRRADAERVLAIQNGLLADETTLRNAEAAADQQKVALAALAQQRQNLLAVAQSEKTDVQVQVGELEDTSAEAEAALEALVREKQQEEDARRAAERRAAQLSGQALPPEPGAPGQLLWPVSGPITSPFGMRMHPVYGRPILHAGIDIAAATGTTIAAAADGRVIVAGYEGDCGKMVAIDHHGGLSTIYCHMSQIFVGVGQDVQRGQAIGAVGMTGDATGPHVHFQVMENGHPVDPMSFLR
ncbi:MAG TPA: peptidoglycan DD-metalloendopeptidase family protein [Candidatus Lustribacter sp.]|jgi:murein DD-endopeptidase MepM/ murein hydrolase activator NlpD|nr:peptidoglycan DD-metalloendopeptidase family protein [Candidatus Lustribacter sp.]